MTVTEKLYLKMISKSFHVTYFIKTKAIEFLFLLYLSPWIDGQRRGMVLIKVSGRPELKLKTVTFLTTQVQRQRSNQLNHHRLFNCGVNLNYKYYINLVILKLTLEFQSMFPLFLIVYKELKF